MAPNDQINESKLNRYVFEEFLGQGTTAHVYAAHTRASHDKVAIKVMDKLLIQHAQMEQRVRQEIELHTQLLHPHIVRVLDVFEDMQNHYIVLELCEKQSLANELKAQPTKTLDEATCKRIFHQLVQGVAYLHANDIIHRDLKLSNVLLTAKGDVKISDFGLATRITEVHGTMCGTPNFIAPEVLQSQEQDNDDGTYDEAVDLWSLGCILYAVLLGKPPFEGKRVSETLANVMNANKTKPMTFPTGFSASASDLIRRLLTHKPADRPSARQVLLHPWLRSLQAFETPPPLRLRRQRSRSSSAKATRTPETITRRLFDDNSSSSEDDISSEDNDQEDQEEDEEDEEEDQEEEEHDEEQSLEINDQSVPTDHSVVSVRWRLRLPAHLLRHLVASNVEKAHEIEWLCHEDCTMPLLRKCSFAIETIGICGEYDPRTGRVQVQEPMESIVWTRFGQCLAMRSFELRARALRRRRSLWPLVHYEDKVPDRLVQWILQRTQFERELQHQLSVKNEEPATVSIGGVGAATSERDGALRLAFVDGSRLALDASGRRLSYQRSADDKTEEFELSIGCSASQHRLLPSEVRKKLEHVPHFIMRLRHEASG